MVMPFVTTIRCAKNGVEQMASLRAKKDALPNAWPVSAYIRSALLCSAAAALLCSALLMLCCSPPV